MATQSILVTLLWIAVASASSGDSLLPAPAGFWCASEQFAAPQSGGAYSSASGDLLAPILCSTTGLRVMSSVSSTSSSASSVAVQLQFRDIPIEGNFVIEGNSVPSSGGGVLNAFDCATMSNDENASSTLTTSSSSSLRKVFLNVSSAAAPPHTQSTLLLWESSNVSFILPTTTASLANSGDSATAIDAWAAWMTGLLTTVDAINANGQFNVLPSAYKSQLVMDIGSNVATLSVDMAFVVTRIPTRLPQPPSWTSPSGHDHVFALAQRIQETILRNTTVHAITSEWSSTIIDNSTSDNNATAPSSQTAAAVVVCSANGTVSLLQLSSKVLIDVVSPQVSPLRISRKKSLANDSNTTFAGAAGSGNIITDETLLVRFPSPSTTVITSMNRLWRHQQMLLPVAISTSSPTSPLATTYHTSVFIGSSWHKIAVTPSLQQDAAPSTSVVMPIVQWVIELAGVIRVPSNVTTGGEDAPLSRGLLPFLLSDSGVSLRFASNSVNSSTIAPWRCSNVIVNDSSVATTNSSTTFKRMSWTATCWVMATSETTSSAVPLLSRVVLQQAAPVAVAYVNATTNVSVAAAVLNATFDVTTTDDVSDAGDIVNASLVWGSGSVVELGATLPLELLLRVTVDGSDTNESVAANFSITSFALVPIVSPRAGVATAVASTATRTNSSNVTAVQLATNPTSSRCTELSWREDSTSLGIDDASSSSLADALVPITVSVLGGVAGALLLVVIGLCFVFRRRRHDGEDGNGDEAPQQGNHNVEKEGNGHHHRRRVYPAVLATVALLFAVACVILVGVGLDERHATFPNVVVLEVFLNGGSCSRSTWSAVPFQVLFLDAGNVPAAALVTGVQTTTNLSSTTSPVVCPASDANMWALAAEHRLRWSRVVSVGDAIGSPGLSMRSAAVCSTTSTGGGGMWVRLRSLVGHAPSNVTSLFLPTDVSTSPTAAASSSSLCTQLPSGALPWLPTSNTTSALLSVSVRATCLPASAAPMVFAQLQGENGMNVWFDAQRAATPVPVASAYNGQHLGAADAARLSTLDRRAFFEDRRIFAVATSTTTAASQRHDDDIIAVIALEQRLEANSTRNMNIASTFTTLQAVAYPLALLHNSTTESDALATLSTVPRNASWWRCSSETSAPPLPTPVALAGTCPVQSIGGRRDETATAVVNRNNNFSTALLDTTPSTLALLRLIGAEGTAFNPAATTRHAEPLSAAMYDGSDDTTGSSGSDDRRDPSKDPTTIMWFQRIAMNPLTQDGSTPPVNSAGTSAAFVSSTVFSVTDTLWSFAQTTTNTTTPSESSSPLAAVLADALSASSSSTNGSSSFSPSTEQVAVMVTPQATALLPGTSTSLQHQAVTSDRLDYALRHGMLDDPSNDFDLQDGSVLSQKLGRYAPRPASVLKEALRTSSVLDSPADVADPTLSVYGRVTVTSVLRGCAYAAGDCADDGSTTSEGSKASSYVETTIRLSSLPSVMAATSSSVANTDAVTATSLVWRFAEPINGAVTTPPLAKDAVRELSGLSTIRLDAQNRIADGSWHLISLVCEWTGGRRQCQLHVDGATSVSSMGWRKCAAAGMMPLPGAEAASEQWAESLANAAVASSRFSSRKHVGTTFTAADTIGTYGEVQIGPTMSEQQMPAASGYALSQSGSVASVDVAHVVVLPVALRRSEIRSVMGVASLSSSQKSASYALSIMGLACAGAALVKTVVDLARSIWKDRRQRATQERRDKRREFEGNALPPTANRRVGHDGEEGDDDRGMTDIGLASRAGGGDVAVTIAEANHNSANNTDGSTNNSAAALSSATRKLRDNLEADHRRKNVGGQLSVAANSASAGVQQISRSTAQATTTTTSTVAFSSQVTTHLRYLLSSVLNVGQMLSIYFSNWSWPSELTNVANQLVRWLTIDWNFSLVAVHQYVIPALAVALTGAVALLYWAVIDNDEEEFLTMVQRSLGGGSSSAATTTANDAPEEAAEPLQTTQPSGAAATHDGNSSLRLPETSSSAPQPRNAPPNGQPQQNTRQPQHETRQPQHETRQPPPAAAAMDRTQLMAEMQANLIAQQSCLAHQNSIKSELAAESQEGRQQHLTIDALPETDARKVAFQQSLHKQAALFERQKHILAMLSTPAPAPPAAAVGDHMPPPPAPQRPPSISVLPPVLTLVPLTTGDTPLVQQPPPSSSATTPPPAAIEVVAWSPLVSGGGSSAVFSPLAPPQLGTTVDTSSSGGAAPPAVTHPTTVAAPAMPTTAAIHQDVSTRGMKWLAHLWASDGRCLALDAHSPQFATALANVVAQASSPSSSSGMSDMSSCRIGIPSRRLPKPTLSSTAHAATLAPQVAYFTASFTATLTRRPAAPSLPAGGGHSRPGAYGDADDGHAFKAARRAIDQRCEDIRKRARQREKLKKKLRKLEKSQLDKDASHQRVIGSLEATAAASGDAGTERPPSSGGASAHHHRHTSSHFSAADDMSDEDNRQGGDDLLEVNTTAHANRSAMKRADGGVDDAVVVECYLTPEGNALDGGHRGFLALHPLHDGVRCPYHGRRLGMAFEVHKHAHKYANVEGFEDEDDGGNEGGTTGDRSSARRCCAYHSTTGRCYRVKRGLAPCPSRHTDLEDDADFFLCPKRGCAFSVCDACYEGTSTDLGKSVFVGAIDTLKRMGVVQVLGFIVILIAQLILAPVMQTCVMVLFCHASYQCQFPGCYLTPSVSFLIFACLAALTLAVAVFGLTASLVVVTLRRKRLIVSSIVAAAASEGAVLGANITTPRTNDITWWTVLKYPLDNYLWRLLLDRDRSMLRSLYEPYKFRFMWCHPLWMVCRASAVLPAVFGDPDSLPQLGGAWGVEMAFLLAASLVPLYSDRWVTFMSRAASVHQVAQVSLNLLYQTYEDGSGLEASGVIDVPANGSGSTASTARTAIAATMLWLFVAYCAVVVVVLLAAVVVPFLWQRHVRQREEERRAKAFSKRARRYEVGDELGLADDGIVASRAPPRAPRGDPRGWRDRYSAAAAAA